MIWQDGVIMAANVVFSLSLLPQVVRGFQEKRGHITLATSIPTTIGLFLVAVSFFTLSLYFSAVTSFITGMMWLILLMQKIGYGNR